MGSEDREAIGYDGEVFYLGLALDSAYVEGCLDSIGENDQQGEDMLRGEWEEGDWEMVLEILKGPVRRPGGQTRVAHLKS